MNALDSRIKELVAYARERDGEDRTALFRNLIDLFLTDNAPTKQPTRAQLLDVVNALIPHVEPESRKTVSDLLASMSNPPMDLVHYIVRDRASIVSKLLKEAPFDEDQLIELVETTGREHHQELASRNDLSANVWIALARATPAAPPYGSKSTLALWKEDLGLSEASLTDAQTKQNHGTSSASIMALHGNHHQKSSAKLRILKTNEDIISHHVPEDQNDPDTIKFIDNDQEKADTNPLDQVPEENRRIINEKDFTDTEMQETDASDAKNQDITKGNEWHWTSDRDGLITKVSDQAPEMEGGKNILGATMLDMLSLNSKLGHPVSRAFQRRSQIHDAPIYLAHLNQNQRYWHLTAEPAFEAGTGKFEGYHGTMRPIVPSQEPSDIIPADETAHTSDKISENISAVEPPSTEATNNTQMSGNIIDRPNPLKDRANWFDARSSKETLDEEISSSRVELHTKASKQEIPREQTKKPRPQQDKEATRILERVFTESFDSERLNTGKLDTGKKDDLPDNNNDRLAVKADPVERKNEAAPSTESRSAEELNPNEPISDNSDPDTIPATIELLDEALSRLAKAEQSGNALQIRLQAEIAQACVRTLKSELSKK